MGVWKLLVAKNKQKDEKLRKKRKNDDLNYLEKKSPKTSGNKKKNIRKSTKW